MLCLDLLGLPKGSYPEPSFSCFSAYPLLFLSFQPFVPLYPFLSPEQLRVTPRPLPISSSLSSIYSHHHFTALYFYSTTSIPFRGQLHPSLVLHLATTNTDIYLDDRQRQPNPLPLVRSSFTTYPPSPNFTASNVFAHHFPILLPLQR